MTADAVLLTPFPDSVNTIRHFRVSKDVKEADSIECTGLAPFLYSRAASVWLFSKGFIS